MLVFPLTAGAATFKTGESYTLSKGQIIEDNFYVGAGEVMLSGVIFGDSSVAGGNVTVTGPVAEDLSVVGGSLTVLGDVGDDVKLAGGDISVGGNVGGELLAVGGLINVFPDAVVAEDVTLSGGKLVFSGTTEGNLMAYGEEVEVHGTVKGNIEGEMGRLIIGESAVIGGDINYSGPKEAVIKDGAMITGNVDYSFVDGFSEDEVKFAFKGLSEMIFSLMVIKYLAFILMGLLFTLWFTKKSNTLIKRTQKNFGMDLVLGLAAAILIPIVFIIFLVTGVGSVLGVMGLMVASLLFLTASIYAGIYLGVVVRNLLFKKKDALADWKSALLGQTLLTVVMFIPLIGWLFGAVLILAVYGSLIRLAHDRFWMTR
ncbi:polymer-forming cytoskeletal protein [Patescibacteria group bacterium]